jgi:hypothetical protein
MKAPCAVCPLNALEWALNPAGSASVRDPVFFAGFLGLLGHTLLSRVFLLSRTIWFAP